MKAQLQYVVVVVVVVVIIIMSRLGVDGQERKNIFFSSPERADQLSGPPGLLLTGYLTHSADVRR